MEKLKKMKRILVTMMCLMVFVFCGLSSKAEAIPRIIISGYTSVPEDIKAGDTFTLTLHIENKSAKTAVSNMKLTLESATGEFVPTSGSGTLYIDKITAGETKDVSIEMRVKANLDTETYILTVTTEYEDRYDMVYQDVTNLSIPVKQVSNVSITEKSISSECIEVGQKANVMFSVNNRGKSVLYNVNVAVSGKGIDESTYFIGNIQAGGTGYADLLVKGIEKNSEDGIVKVVITFEDSEGNSDSMVEEFELEVRDADDTLQMNDDAGEVQKEKTYGVSEILLAVGALFIVIGVVVKKLKKKKEEDEDEI